MKVPEYFRAAAPTNLTEKEAQRWRGVVLGAGTLACLVSGTLYTFGRYVKCSLEAPLLQIFSHRSPPLPVLAGLRR